MHITAEELTKVNLSPQASETKVHCPKHGKVWFSYFVMPKPNSFVSARYVCARCIEELQGEKV
jgi:hypothetical protein